MKVVFWKDEKDLLVLVAEEMECHAEWAKENG